MRRSPDAVLVGAPVPSLVPWGHSTGADLVYRTLVTFGPATATQLRQQLNLPARRIAPALEELASIGAVRRRTLPSQRADEWVAAPPAEVVATLRQRRVRPAPAPPPAHPVDLAQLIDGVGLRHLTSRAHTRARLAELNAVSIREHLAMNPEPVFDPESARAAAPLDRKALRRGVKMRILGVRPADHDPLAPYGRDSTEPLPEYRNAGSVPMKLIIIDRAVAFFPVDPGNLERGYLEVSQQPVVEALANLFEQHWESARDPWEWAIPQTALTRREYALISLLAQGHTDASAARRLHVGVRTVSTILRGLMDRFGVDNRFQLGLVLGALRAAEPPTGRAAAPEEG